MSQELKPCPFCGGKALPAEVEQIEHSGWVGRIECEECDAVLSHQYSFNSPGKAGTEVIAAWNKRAQHAGEAREPVTVNIHMVKIKTRREIEKTIPRERWGWWKDVSAGQHLVLRDATAADLARCCKREGDMRGPDEFLCELPANGSLVSREALEFCRTVPVYAAPQPAALPEGWKIVPEFPTPGILAAIYRNERDSKRAWRDALAAAPQPSAPMSATPAAGEGEHE